MELRNLEFGKNDGAEAMEAAAEKLNNKYLPYFLPNKFTLTLRPARYYEHGKMHQLLLSKFKNSKILNL